MMIVSMLLLLVGVASAQDYPELIFECPEPNGLFPDKEQCDLYYLCEDKVAEPVLCPDGLLFDYTVRNREKCVLPHNVECGDRVFVQEPKTGIDERCPRANGFFDHVDPSVCDKFYSCDKGTAFEMSCANPLHFDSTKGTCVRREQLAEEAKHCGNDEDELGKKTIEGFSCPGGPRIGPQGLRQEHPVYPHPADCRFFFTCYFGTDPNKFGCSQGQVFDEVTEVCKPAEEVPECACWYECPASCKSGQCDPNCKCIDE